MTEECVDAASSSPGGSEMRRIPTAPAAAATRAACPGSTRRTRRLGPRLGAACLTAAAMMLLAAVQVAGAAASRATTSASTSTGCAAAQFCTSFAGSGPLTGTSGYDGVQPCGGSYTGTVSYHGVIFDTGGWQCVELASRWLYAYTGKVPLGPTGQLVATGRDVASAFHARYPVYPLYPPSGGTAAYDLTIRPGDIISMWTAGSGSAGHVAVVTNVSVSLTNGGNGTGTISVMDENYHTAHPHNITVTGGQMSYGGYNQFQWLELAPGPSAAASVPG